MPIPDGSTPIKHEILTDIFAKGLLSYPELRIILFIIRWSWGFHDNWTKEFKVSEIAKEINMGRGDCSRVINKMVRDGTLLRESNKYQFNEHYEKWQSVPKKNTIKAFLKRTESVPKKNTPVPRKNACVPRKNTPNVQETPIETEPEGKNENHKEIFKEINTKISKDTYTRIFNFWNSLKIIEHKDTPKLRRKIIASLKVYTPEELEDSMKNYAYILNNPDKFYWTYKWQLRDFLDRGIERFLPVNFKEKDYLKRVYKSKAELEEERSMGILSRVFREEEEKENDKKGNDSNPGSPEGSI